MDIQVGAALTPQDAWEMICIPDGDLAVREQLLELESVCGGYPAMSLRHQASRSVIDADIWAFEAAFRALETRSIKNA